MKKKTLLSILTAFVMAFTVFGCTGMSFAETTAGEPEAVDEPETQMMDNGQQEEGNVPDVDTNPEDNDATVGLMSMNLAGEVGSTSIKLSWDAAEPATTGWDVYYVLSGGNVSDVEISETTYTVTGLKPNTKYTFEVQAWEKDPEGVEKSRSIDSDQVILTTDYTKPAAPELDSSKTKSTVTTISYTWKTVKAPNGGKISYKLYSSKDGNPIKTLTTTTWKKTGLTQRGSLSHTYYIKAVETLPDGTVAESAFGTLTASLKNFKAQKLTGLVSDPGYKAVLLQWNKMDGAAGYKIYWRQGGERGNIDTVGRDSDGHWMKTFRSKKTKKYVMPVKPGNYKYLTKVEQPKSGSKVTFDKRGLKVMNHTYVYFYQFMVIPYYDDAEGEPIYTTAVPENKWKASDVNKTTNEVAGKSNYRFNIVRNNTVLPMYVYESAKVNKPIYKTSSMGDGKKRGRLAKGHKFICWDKANGRVKFYEKKDVSNPSDTYWFAQKNASTIQGYYMDNCRHGANTDLNRKDWQTGYSKKTVLDYVNKSGLTSKTKYLVWTSKYAQHTYIFTGSKGKWKLLDNGANRLPTKTKGCWSNLCSSGKVNIQSRNGNYIIFGKQYKAKRSAYDYYCLSKMHETVRLHSLLYKKGAKFGSSKYKNKVLGNPVSKGCIRLRPYAAQWIYKNVPKKSRSLVY